MDSNCDDLHCRIDPGAPTANAVCALNLSFGQQHPSEYLHRSTDMKASKVLHIAELVVVLAAAFGLVACQSASKAQGHMAFPPPPVSVLEVQPQDVPIYGEYAAQTFARDMVEVRGRVDGFIEKRLFQVGSDVQAGQTLYILDLRPYAADVILPVRRHWTASIG